MAMVYVKTKQGRKAFYEGKIIPTDQFIPVTDDPYIRRLINHWGDLEVQDSADAAKTKSAPKTTAPPPAQRTAPSTPAPAPAPGTGAPKPQN